MTARSRRGSTPMLSPGVSGAASPRRSESQEMTPSIPAVIIEEDAPGLNERFLDEMIHRMTIKRYNPQEVIVKKGDIGHEMYFITRGTVDIVLPNKVINLQPGAFFGEVAIFTDSTRMATVQAHSEVDVLVLKRPVLLRVLEKWPAVKEQFDQQARDRMNSATGGTTGTAASAGADWMHKIAEMTKDGYDPTVQVILRIRPKISKEVPMSQIIYRRGANHCYTLDTSLPTKKQQEASLVEYKFDFVYDDTATTESIFEVVGNHVVDAAYDGFNTCVFAYGQTGTGKTYTMEGMSPLICREMFSRINEERARDSSVNYIVKLSYVEIYIERVKDLLLPSRNGVELRLRENRDGEVYVENATKKEVTSIEDVDHLLKLGNRNRVTAGTTENENSSPGHAIVMVYLRKLIRTQSGGEITQDCKMNLVDLAGTHREKERLDRSSLSGNLEAIRAEQAEIKTGPAKEDSSKINLSLETLSTVVDKLAFGSSGHIPYRNSTLTRLLSQCFGGNSKTYMVACVNPTDYRNTIRTLRKAQNAMNMVNKPVRAPPKGLLLGALLPGEQYRVNAPQTEYPLDKLIQMIEEANALCLKTGNKVVFSLEPHEELSAQSKFAIRVSDVESTKHDLWVPSQFEDTLKLEKEWVDKNLDSTKTALKDGTDVSKDPFNVRPPDHLIGTMTVNVKDLLNLQAVEGDYKIESSDGSGMVTLKVKPEFGTTIKSLQPRTLKEWIDSGRDPKLQVSIPDVTELDTEYNCGVFVRYYLPGAPTPCDTERSPATPMHAHNYNHTATAPIDRATLAAITSESAPQELTVEVWGHEPEDMFYPGKLKAMLHKKDDLLRALEIGNVELAKRNAELEGELGQIPTLQEEIETLKADNARLKAWIKKEKELKPGELRDKRERNAALAIMWESFRRMIAQRNALRAELEQEKATSAAAAASAGATQGEQGKLLVECRKALNDELARVKELQSQLEAAQEKLKDNERSNTELTSQVDALATEAKISTRQRADQSEILRLLRVAQRMSKVPAVAAQ